jgi:hypothetical protein
MRTNGAGADVADPVQTVIQPGWIEHAANDIRAAESAARGRRSGRRGEIDGGGAFGE